MNNSRRKKGLCNFWNFVRGWRLGLLVIALSLMETRAILFYSTDDPAFNTTSPTGALSGSGWELQGQWGSFLGTPIAPSYFITSSHVGGAVGQFFTLNGVNYEATASFDDSESDLRIWKISGTFPSHASLYTGTDEVGESVVLFGRGASRQGEGGAVFGDSLGGTEQKGWLWGTDKRQRWGENVIESVVNGGSGLGELLEAQFDAGGGVNEAHLSTGDSGGGVFVNDGGVWKLAGVNFGVDGKYNTTDTGDGFNAAIYDEGGLYQQVSGGWAYVNDQPFDLPGSLYMTRISSRDDWILAVVPEPAEYGVCFAILLLGGACYLRQRRTLA